MPSLRIQADERESTAEAHIAQIIKSARALFANDGAIEDALDAVLERARREFQCRIVVSSPARLIIDGGRFEWPVRTE